MTACLGHPIPQRNEIIFYSFPRKKPITKCLQVYGILMNIRNMKILEIPYSGNRQLVFPRMPTFIVFSVSRSNRKREYSEIVASSRHTDN